MNFRLAIFLVQHGATPHDAVMESLQRFGEQVIPQFREAATSPEGAAVRSPG